MYRGIRKYAVFIAFGWTALGQPVRFEQPVLKADGSIDFRLVGAADKSYRVEVSSDLRNWTLFTVLNNTKVFTDRPGATQKFYRAVEVDAQTGPGFQIDSFQPAAGLPGTEIVIQGADGTGLRRLTSNSIADRDPAWLPDSSALIFSSERPGGAELFIVSRVGGTPQPVTISAGANTEPSLGH